jgi:hypothetical protein
MGMQRRRVPRGLDDLLETGAATVDKPLATQSGVWHGNYYDRALEWVDRPTITVHPDLRAKERHRPLGKCVLKVSHMKGTPMDAAELPLRTVERLANLERDVALLKEDLGVVPDEEARDTVERFLGSFEDTKQPLK